MNGNPPDGYTVESLTEADMKALPFAEDGQGIKMICRQSDVRGYQRTCGIVVPRAWEPTLCVT